LKIAEVVAVFPPYPGGTGYVCWHNAHELSRRGHDVTVFTLDFHGLRSGEDPKEFAVVRMKARAMLGGGGLVPQLYSMLRSFDVVHLHYPFYGGAEYVYLVSRMKGTAYFTTYHQDPNADTVVKKMLIGAYNAILLPRILRCSSKVGILSYEHFNQSKAAKLVDRNNVVEIPNGVDTDIFSVRDKDQTLVKRHGLEGKTVILFVGHLLPFKGLHILLDALSRMDTSDVVLIVVGVGPMEPEYRKFAAEKGIEDSVVFAGYKDQLTELPSYYNTCDFLVLPSIGAPESFGMVILEAMASAKPSIVSALPGPSQLVDDGADGLISAVADPGDLKCKMEYMVREQEKRRAMGTLARQKVLEKYSWSRIGNKLEDILKGIAG
jgi:glycosyltransferase involved in cell wall biosynthesis